METKDFEFLDKFAEKLSEALVGQCTADGMLDVKMLTVDELNEKWRASAPEYMAAAVPQIAAGTRCVGLLCRHGSRRAVGQVVGRV